ncbi:MAG: PQQ-binding-like beta-propeller repeat protein [Adlercreutzia sp.]
MPYSITTPDRSRTLAMSASAPWSYWAFFVNGAYADTTWRAVMSSRATASSCAISGGRPAPGGRPSVSPDAPHPEVELAFGAGRDNVAHVSDFVASGTSAAPGTAKWTSSLLADEERAAGSSASVSAPFMLGGYVYIVTGSVNYAQGTASAARLEVRDAATGEVLRSVALARPMDTTCRPAYSDGIVVVPLSGGWLQAVSAVTLETLWVSPGTAGAQSLSSVTVADGLVYACTADELAAGTYEAVRGTVRCVDLLTGEERGAFANERAGYYSAGGVAVGGLYLVADDRGTVTAFEQGLAKVAATLDVGAGVRSALVRDGDDVLAVTRTACCTASPWRRLPDRGGEGEVRRFQHVHAHGGGRPRLAWAGRNSTARAEGERRSRSSTPPL